MKRIMEFDVDGNISTLYTDDINLYQLGVLQNVRRASEIIFDECRQEWVVVTAMTRAPVARFTNRTEAIDWEIENFSPGGRYYEAGNH